MKKIKIEHLSDEEVRARGISSWPVWEKEKSRFDWEYDVDEECLILEGEVVVETDDGAVEIKAGDFVTFPNGLKCTWDIKKDLKKHFNFK